MRQRTFLEMQPYMFAYGACISVVSPGATAYQLSKIFNVQKTVPELFKMSFRIFPHQTLLKAAQMDASTPVKDFLNPWAAFFAVGVLQGGVYGQSNIYFSRALELGKSTSYAKLFRGVGYAGGRDTISQGVPFMLAGGFKTHVIDPVVKFPENSPGDQACKYAAVLSTSVCATTMSQGLHNLQIAMQADQALGYASALRSLWNQHGVRFLWRGVEARVGLLALVCVLNEMLLKPAWSPVLDDSNNSVE